MHWNVEREPFLHKEIYTWTEEIEKPKDEQEGTFWRKSSAGWHKVAEKCIQIYNAKMPNNYLITLQPPEECEIRFVPHSIGIRTVWKQSVSDFAENLLYDGWGGYQKISVLIVSVLIFGCLMYVGKIERLINWVKHGKGD